MPRDGSGVYSKASVTPPASGNVISSSDHISTIDDLVTDANTARPIVAGGTGATSASGARTNFAVPGSAENETVSGDWTVSGNWTISADMTFGDNVNATFGAGTDGQIYSDGSDFIVEARAGQTLRLKEAGGGHLARFYTGAGIDLSFNNTTKLQITAAGAEIADGGLVLNERADHALTPVAAHGELWVKDDAPCAPIFTDDAGTDNPLAYDFGTFHLQETETSGTGAGNSSAATWHKRTIASDTNTITGASVSAGVVTLPAGTYEASFWSAGYKVDGMQSRLRDTTNTTTLGAGSTMRAEQSSGVEDSVISAGFKRFTLAGSADLELQTYATSAQTDGLGLAATTGENEVYAELIIRRVA